MGEYKIIIKLVNPPYATFAETRGWPRIFKSQLQRQCILNDLITSTSLVCKHSRQVYSWSIPCRKKRLKKNSCVLDGQLLQNRLLSPSDHFQSAVENENKWILEQSCTPSMLEHVWYTTVKSGSACFKVKCDKYKDNRLPVQGRNVTSFPWNTDTCNLSQPTNKYQH